ncbi:unnamed protein product [Phytophthora fragariaefolia]|uniref:Unnamed protein product n=1 Tax=Phytophthora fragariaefolia TaxID=1490495 RepID=A0A9W6YQ95_9STRA|nr:unnamed protein product [Phytophthora fragariaefolia]
MKAARPAMLHGVGLIRSPSAVFSMRFTPPSLLARALVSEAVNLALLADGLLADLGLDPSFTDQIAAGYLALDAGLGLDASFADRAGTTALALLAELDLDVPVAERTGDLARGGVLDGTGALAVAETGAEVLVCDFGFEEPARVDSSPEKSDDSTSLFDKLGGVTAEPPPPVESPPSESESLGLHAGCLPGGRARITTDLVAPLRDASVEAASVCLEVDELSTPDESAPSGSSANADDETDALAEARSATEPGGA